MIKQWFYEVDEDNGNHCIIQYNNGIRVSEPVGVFDSKEDAYRLLNKILREDTQVVTFTFDNGLVIDDNR